MKSLDEVLEEEIEDYMLEIKTLNEKQKIFIEALNKIADPRLRDHKEPDDYTEKCCLMHIAEDALLAAGILKDE